MGPLILLTIYWKWVNHSATKIVLNMRGPFEKSLYHIVLSDQSGKRKSSGETCQVFHGFRLFPKVYLFGVCLEQSDWSSKSLDLCLFTSLFTYLLPAYITRKSFKKVTNRKVSSSFFIAESTLLLLDKYQTQVGPIAQI